MRKVDQASLVFIHISTKFLDIKAMCFGRVDLLASITSSYNQEQ